MESGPFQWNYYVLYTNQLIYGKAGVSTIHDVNRFIEHATSRLQYEVLGFYDTHQDRFYWHVPTSDDLSHRVFVEQLLANLRTDLNQ
ncbi:hypothetical protein [Spirosoma pulveris]